MADSFIRVPPDSTGKLIDTSQLTVGANDVQRERMIIGDNVDNNFATVTASKELLVLADQGAAAALAGAWPVEITDGSNVLGTPTHPVRTDPTGTTIQPVSWTSQTVTVTQGTGTNLHTVVDSGTITAVTAITNALPAGTNVIGHVIVDSAPSTVVTGNVGILPITAGGCSIFHLVSAATTNETTVKASAGQVYGITVYNNAGYPVYVKFHNTASTPTPGSGVVRTFGVQAGTQAFYSQPAGIAFGTGIGITIVKGIADNNSTAVAASDCVLDVEYK